jgi:hypothetical protein
MAVRVITNLTANVPGCRLWWQEYLVELVALEQVWTHNDLIAFLEEPGTPFLGTQASTESVIDPQSAM